jgi:hypothetical protein
MYSVEINEAAIICITMRIAMAARQYVIDHNGMPTTFLLNMITIQDYLALLLVMTIRQHSHKYIMT